jgi:hypothetical protein
VAACEKGWGYRTASRWRRASALCVPDPRMANGGRPERVGAMPSRETSDRRHREIKEKLQANRVPGRVAVLSGSVVWQDLTARWIRGCCLGLNAGTAVCRATSSTWPATPRPSNPVSA